MKAPAAYVNPELKQQCWHDRAALASQGRKKPYVKGFAAPAAIRGKGPVGPVVSEEEKQEHLEIVRLVQKGKGSIEAIADVLNCAPKDARQRIAAAAAAGYNVKWHGDGVVFAPDRPADPSDALYVPWDGTERCFGVISDSHAGSIGYEKEGQIAFIKMAHQCGAEEIWHAGDLLEGTYYFRGGQMEQTAVGYEAQTREALEGLPALPGLNYRILTGNHDFVYFKEVGLDPIANMVKASGRTDMTAMGYPVGRLVYGDDPDTLLKIELAHPKTRPAYAASWPLQKFVERMQGGSKPHVLVMGHLHSMILGEFRSILCLMPGCWQAATTFEASQGLEPAVGGVLLWIRREGREFKIRHEWHALRARPVQWFAPPKA
jgi:predicted phosphodiesterase